MSGALRGMRGFWPELAVGLAISLAAAAMLHLLRPLFGSADALRLILLGTAAAYSMWLLHAAQARVGRMVAALGLGALSLGLLLWNPGIWTWIVGLLGYLWLLRCLYRHDSLLAAAVDGGLVLLALAVALASLEHTRSLWLTLWCYFLTQSLHHAIPSGWGARPAPGERASADNTSFDQAYRASEAAFSRLASRR